MCFNGCYFKQTSRILPLESLKEALSVGTLYSHPMANLLASLLLGLYVVWYGAFLLLEPVDAKI
jgi:hypothetical protein